MERIYQIVLGASQLWCEPPLHPPQATREVFLEPEIHFLGIKNKFKTIWDINKNLKFTND